MRQRLDGMRGAQPVDALASMARWYKPGSTTDDMATDLLIVLIAPALAVVHALLLLKVLMALWRLLRALRVADASPLRFSRSSRTVASSSAFARVTPSSSCA